MSRARDLANLLDTNSKISADSIDLADDFTFTGNVTGAGDLAGFVYLDKVNIDVTNGVVSFDDIFNSSYGAYKLVLKITTSVNNTGMDIRFLKASDGLVDTAANIDYVSHGRDNDGGTRNTSANNKEYWSPMYLVMENVASAFFDINLHEPFSSSERTMGYMQGNYMVNDDDTVTFNSACSTETTTSYSGIQITLSTATGGSPAASTLTGYLLVYGIAGS